MTTDTFDILGECQTILEGAKAAIQAQMEFQGVNATGNTSRSFRVERYHGGVRLVMGGTDYKTAPLPTLEVGRPAGPIPSNMTDILVQWSRDKGFPFDRESRRRSFAYLLGKRIQREGTLRHTTPVDVYSSIVTDAANSVTADVINSITIFLHNPKNLQQ